MPVRWGDDNPATFKFGDDQVLALYYGDDLVWTSLTPELLTYSTVGTHEYETPVGFGYYIDRVAVGAGCSGHDSTFGAAAGGEGGFWAWDTIQEGVDFTAGDTITIVVGTGRGGGDGNVRPGDPCTITVGGDVLTAPPGTSQLGNQSGKPPTGGNAASGKNVTLNGQTYVGGDANGEAPGAGGKGGGGGFQPGERSGDGRAWLYVYPQS